MKRCAYSSRVKRSHAGNGHTKQSSVKEDGGEHEKNHDGEDGEEDDCNRFGEDGECLSFAINSLLTL